MKLKPLVIAVVFTAAIGLLASAGAAAPHGISVKATPSAKVTLHVWDVFYFPKQKGSAGAVGRAELAIDRAFMKKYPNVTVSHEGVPGNDFFTDIRKFVASRQGPDIITNGGSSFSANQGLTKALYPMYKLITPQMKAELAGYLKGEGIGDEAHYSIPTLAGVYAFAYNKQMFKVAGIKGPPTTFDQLLNDCTALTNKGILPITNGFQGIAGPVPFYYGTSPLTLNAKGLLDWNNFKIGWSDPRIINALTYIQQMAEKGCFGPRAEAATRTDADGFSAFTGGRGAMNYNGGSITAAGFPTKAALNNIGWFAFPKVPTSVWPAGTPDSGYNANWSITNYTKVCRTAWNYVQFYDSVQGQTLQWTIGHWLPANTKVKTTATSSFDRELLALAANPYGHHGVGGTISAPENTYLDQTFSELISGQLTASQLASQMQVQRATVPVPPATPLPNPPPCVDGKNVAG